MISFGFFIDWQLGIVLLWLLYRAALAGRIPLVVARAYLLAVVPVAAAVAGFKVETLHAVLAVPSSLVESVGTRVAGSEAVVAFDYGVLYNIVALGVALVWVVGAAVWLVGWSKGRRFGGVRICSNPRGGVASSLFGCIVVDASSQGTPHFEALLAHERAHVRCGHSWDMLYLCVLRSALWINPVVWLLSRDLVHVHEAQADAVVIGSGLSRRNYIDMLLGAQIGSAGAAVPERLTTVHYFSYLSVKTRIKMMTRTFPTRRTLWRLVAVLPVVGAMLTLFSFTRTEVVLNPTLVVSESPQSAAQQPNNTPIFKAEVMPKFQGKDLNAFRTWVQSHVTYPKAATDQKIQGRVVVTFVVEKDGSVTNVAVLRGVNPQLDEAAVAVIQSSPKWTPGLTNNEPVRIRYNMPVDFVLDKTTETTSGVITVKRFAADPDPETPVFNAEVMPKFEGKDIHAFRTWVLSRVSYPAAAAEQGIQGRVNLTFVVEKDGSVTNVAVLRGVVKSIDSAAVSVIQSSPKWTPGLIKNKPVRIRYNMPVDFALQ